MVAAHVRTEEIARQVAAAAQYGLTQEQVGIITGTSEVIVRKYYNDEFHTARTKVLSMLARRAIFMALNNPVPDPTDRRQNPRMVLPFEERTSMTMLMFCLKTQAGWHETSVVKGANPDGSIPISVSSGDPQALDPKALAALTDDERDALRTILRKMGQASRAPPMIEGEVSDGEIVDEAPPPAGPEDAYRPPVGVPVTADPGQISDGKARRKLGRIPRVKKQQHQEGETT